MRGRGFGALTAQVCEAVSKVGIKCWDLSCHLYIPPQHHILSGVSSYQLKLGNYFHQSIIELLWKGILSREANDVFLYHAVKLVFNMGVYRG